MCSSTGEIPLHQLIWIGIVATNYSITKRAMHSSIAKQVERSLSEVFWWKALLQLLKLSLCARRLLAENIAQTASIGGLRHIVDEVPLAYACYNKIMWVCLPSTSEVILFHCCGNCGGPFFTLDEVSGSPKTELHFNTSVHLILPS